MKKNLFRILFVGFFGYIFIIAPFIKENLFKVVNVSMSDTLLDGDFVYTENFNSNKVKSDYLLNKICIIESRYIDPEITFIKRCIGGPGDTLIVKTNNDIINISKSNIDFFKFNKEHCQIMLPKKAPIVDNPVIESLDNMEASYKINREKGFLDCYLLSSQITQLIDLINSDNQLTEYEVIENVSFKNDTIIVPYCGMKKDSSLSISTVLADSEKTWNEDYYYFLGDNREKSIDSRNWGPIPSSRIIKIANKIVFSIDDGQIRWTRIKKTI